MDALKTLIAGSVVCISMGRFFVWTDYLEETDVRSSTFGFGSVESIDGTAFLLPSSSWLLLLSSRLFSRLSLIPDHTPVPRNSSVCPAAYPTKSMVDLMVQYTTMVGGTASNSVVRGRKAAAGFEERGTTNPETMKVKRCRVRRKRVNSFAMMVLLVVGFTAAKHSESRAVLASHSQNRIQMPWWFVRCPLLGGDVVYACRTHKMFWRAGLDVGLDVVSSRRHPLRVHVSTV